ncbi:MULTISPECIES: hypothetical protein [Pasteurellaceae]|uniref:Uncharacterized protein n=1 Tax=Pasteurella atlantica TaxID=2827233 RepID=A0AAW8CPZ5_9PAST|nr:hypothetical protein [Pasteurella atlantica]MBR0573431.1 hypothetical protein [Pasteurella atlantica]MDP8039432.1 hypothetical protein [Pasteurella atlantica]MDP8041523.1 hypothetical protein [Pasteurella atlantica]MDP8043660.1 hypothetical protein [Pasteurella atlantica]MDP8045843.1 hypothetical protein [Pasteurella atlantica]
MKIETKGNSLNKKRKWKIYAFFLFIFLLVIKEFTPVNKAKEFIQRNYPMNCQLTKSEFEKAVWKDIGYILLKSIKQHKNGDLGEVYNFCKPSSYCDIWLIDRKFTTETLDYKFTTFYTNNISKKYSMLKLYHNFLQSIKAQKYQGGMIDFNKYSLIFNLDGNVEFYDKNHINILGNKLILTYRYTQAWLPFDIEQKIGLEHMLYKNSLLYTVAYAIDNCGRLYEEISYEQ